MARINELQAEIGAEGGVVPSPSSASPASLSGSLFATYQSLCIYFS